MAKLIQYPETVHFRDVIKEVTRETRYFTGDSSSPFPILTFTGTVKLHGSNTAIVYQRDVGHWCQSRNRVITSTNDHAEFAQRMDPLAQTFLVEHLLPSCPRIRRYYEQGSTILIYGEWCGEDIQARSAAAIGGLRKMFVVFKMKVIQKLKNSHQTSTIPVSERFLTSPNGFWLDPQEWRHVHWHDKSIYNIFDFPTYQIAIDFNAPELSESSLTEITNEIERQCPVGAYFNHVGCGEGVVWIEWAHTHGHLTFKVKGQQHAVVNTPMLASVKVPQLNSVADFVEYACTRNRMQQVYDAVREEVGSAMETKGFDTFLRWLAEDIIKEEHDTMNAARIDRKDIARAIRSKANSWFNEQLQDSRKMRTLHKKHFK